ncbi:MAG: polyphosphate kinase 1 [Phycisphaerales bacterium]|nr:polyphosphate kinase 1 [Phycisphaerales bacterium]
MSDAGGQPSISPETSEPAVGGNARFLNREIQWLAFNERVLHQVLDAEMPLLDRVRFLTIFHANLDEFFMKRVGGLRRQLAAGVGDAGEGTIGPEALLRAIRAYVVPLTARAAECFREELLPALERAGIHLLAYDTLGPRDLTEVVSWYRTNVFPVLTPLAVDPGHRFPFISNLSVSLGVMLRRPSASELLFARVKIPEVVDQWYRLGESLRFVSLLEIVQHNLDDLFPGLEVLHACPFRVTRNADVEGDHEDAEDLLARIQQQLRHRRFAPVVRLQVGENEHPRLLRFLAESMELTPRDVYATGGLLNEASLMTIAELPLPQLRVKQWTPTTPPALAESGRDIFSVIRAGDVMVHHPYESFDDSVERFIEEAAVDPDTLGIKQALYRTSGDSPFIPELIRAAEAGKQVAVLVELRARFDEARNIHWARKLEDAGVHVAYGVVGLKTHTKITLVVRREGEELRCYAHIGTGNYHSKTARVYEDVGLLTCDPTITADVVNLFNSITGRVERQPYRTLLVAPHGMKTRFLQLIAEEIKEQRTSGRGRIIAKMNQLEDREIIEALYTASAAGVEIDLIVRGFCTLRPGVPGLSERIRVISIVGRFLEHSRIFYFRRGKTDPVDGLFLIGSADWMHRNLHTRVEAVCPIEARAHRATLWRILETCLADRRLAWDMQPDGRYRLRAPEPGTGDTSATLGTHAFLMRHALERQQARERANGDET